MGIFFQYTVKMEKHLAKIQQLEKKSKGNREGFLRLLNTYENRQTKLSNVLKAYTRHDDDLANNTNIMRKIGEQKALKRAKDAAKGYGVRVTKVVDGKRVPRTVNEIKANLSKKRDYLNGQLSTMNVRSIEYMRNAAKKAGVRVTKSVGGKRVKKTENELAKNLGMFD